MIYATEYHSAVKMNEIALSAAPGMDLGIVTLSEARQRKTHIM